VANVRSCDASNMDSRPGSLEDEPGPARPVQRLARGLEDVSHLFLSGPPAAAPSRSEAQDQPSREASHLAQGLVAPVAGSALSDTNDDRLVSLVCKSVGALEEGLRVIDAGVHLEVGGTVDLVAVDRCNQIVIIDVEPTASDALLLRGICHLDWFARNVPITRRMYPGFGIDFTSDPRVFLLAPRFSPVVLCAVRRVMPLRIACFTYHTAPLLAGTGMFFNHVCEAA
jgi:hypothetical protein